jgi:hypothetical protein
MSETINPKHCDCYTQVNAELAKQNLTLKGYALRASDFKLVPYISLAWGNTSQAPKGQKTKGSYIWASHCPFCGQAIPPAPMRTPPAGPPEGGTPNPEAAP